MNSRLLILLLLAASLTAADIPCFSVGKMFQSDSTRFYVEAVSRCPKFLPAVYVRVRFEGPGISVTSLWPAYGVSPGQRLRHEFAFPVSASGFKKITLLGVVTTLEEGLKP